MAQLKIALVVIIYGKTLEKSLTIQDLLKFKYPLSQLLIVNNGPEAISENDPYINKLCQIHQKVTLQNQLQNKPLSWIYNDFIRDYDADYYVLFDDDTEINQQYQNILFNLKDIDVELPKIRSIIDGNIYYPLIDGKSLNKDEENICSKNIYSIGSGLIISKNIKEFFTRKRNEIFDSHFAFYGVDTSFFRKLNEYKNQGHIFSFSSISYLNHSLSLAEKSMPSWRRKEYLYDNVLTIKYYSRNTYKRNVKIIKLIIKKISRLKLNEVVSVISVFFKGKHPRC